MLIILAQGMLLLRFAMTTNRNRVLVLCHIILSCVCFRACYVKAGELDYLGVKWQKNRQLGVISQSFCYSDTPAPRPVALGKILNANLQFRFTSLAIIYIVMNFLTRKRSHRSMGFSPTNSVISVKLGSSTDDIILFLLLPGRFNWYDRHGMKTMTEMEDSLLEYGNLASCWSCLLRKKM